MKKILVFLAAVIIISGVFSSCKKTTAIPLTTGDINITVPTETPTQRAFALMPLLDDMQDNDNQNNWGGYWYTYDDLGTPNFGDSYVVPWSDAQWAKHSGAGTFFMQSPGYDGAGFAARMTGYVTTTFQYGFVGMGTAFLDPKKDVDLSLCTDISFWEKGDGKAYRMKISSDSPLYVNGVGDNFYGYQFTSSAVWTYHSVPVSTLSKDGTWGSVVPLATAMSTATDLQFQTVGQPQASIDLWIDEIIFTGCGF